MKSLCANCDSRCLRALNWGDPGFLVSGVGQWSVVGSSRVSGPVVVPNPCAAIDIKIKLERTSIRESLPSFDRRPGLGHKCWRAG